MAKDSGTRTLQTGTSKYKFTSRLKFASININSIRGKELELLGFLDFHQPQIVATQETKIELKLQNYFRNLVHIVCTGKIEPLMVLLFHKGISHMPITELENNSETVWVKVFANKTSLFVASWYRPLGGDLVELELQLKVFESQLDKIKDIHKGNKPLSVHVLGDFNFSDEN